MCGDNPYIGAIARNWSEMAAIDKKARKYDTHTGEGYHWVNARTGNEIITNL